MILFVLSCILTSCVTSHLDGLKETSLDSEKIEKGMSVTEVGEIVGLPFRSVTHGLNTLDYLTDDKEIYRIQWDGEMKVVDVSKYQG